MDISFQNLGTLNRNRVKLNNLIIWFSYETPVSFAYKGERITRVNDWSTTTGKLLNELEPDKSKRIDGEIFERKLNAILANV